MTTHLPAPRPGASGHSAGPVGSGLFGRPVIRDASDPAGRNVIVVSRGASAQGDLQGAFKRSGFQVIEAADFSVVERTLAAGSVDLVVIESSILDEDQLSFCRAASAGSARPPVLIVSTNADMIEHIIALEVGADDLVVSPIDERLLMARVRALLRRSQAAPSPAPTGQDSGWRLNPLTRVAISPGGHTISLSQAHAAAFHLFLTHPGVVFTCETAARALGVKANGALAFRTTVCRLRKKLDLLSDGQPIQTVRGVGYVYAGDPEGLHSPAGEELAPPPLSVAQALRRRGSRPAYRGRVLAAGRGDRI